MAVATARQAVRGAAIRRHPRRDSGRQLPLGAETFHPQGPTGLKPLLGEGQWADCPCPYPPSRPHNSFLSPPNLKSVGWSTAPLGQSGPDCPADLRFGAHPSENPKSEIRNPKQIRSTKLEIAASRVSVFVIRILNLFRISDFEFRIFAQLLPVKRVTRCQRDSVRSPAANATGHLPSGLV